MKDLIPIKVNVPYVKLVETNPNETDGVYSSLQTEPNVSVEKAMHKEGDFPPADNSLKIQRKYSQENQPEVEVPIDMPAESLFSDTASETQEELQVYEALQKDILSEDPQEIKKFEGWINSYAQQQKK